jgi:putative serine protease PepD
MKRIFASLALALAMLVPASAADTPIPQAVRVVVQDTDNSFSAGSGTLVRGDLVVTNWHVVKDQAKNGTVTVKFPDGIICDAEVVKTDRAWDLAAVRIEKVDVAPLPLGDRPAAGDVITVGGYGSGDYKSTSGELWAYVSPGRDLAFDVMEVKAVVRNGDSGGGMVMDGKLVGVLFGCDGKATYGSCVSQVRKFLEDIE